MELEALQQVVPELEENGATLIALCPQRPEFLKQMRVKNGLTYDILRDEGNSYADKLGLRHTFPEYLRETYLQLKIDLPRVNGEPSWTLAMPARYVVNTSGVIVVADINPDYTVRPEPQKTVDDIKSLG